MLHGCCETADEVGEAVLVFLKCGETSGVTIAISSTPVK